MVGGNSLVCIYENYFHTWKQMCAVIIIATVMRIFMNILLVCKMLVWGQMGFKQKLFRPVVIYWWSEPCESDGGQHCHRVLIKTSSYWNMWQHISPGYKKTSKLVQTAAKHSNCSNEKKNKSENCWYRRISGIIVNKRKKLNYRIMPVFLVFPPVTSSFRFKSQN